ncbi:FAD/NAD-binding domain-containing protein [Fomitiporia mediterranea MF3/22]|uniref:FAD/NAD-binding domain-containing protein n=1 Tax=Fomitiporia mediterranea (strain MF3/22) TaxID=694068 RepID=UPI0004407CB4|nr:FAD/NAD-binding domain-containing protein [Fomitiporia mediterranea MF3/22]EJC99760.1 FAD/NAD-binding domain-containing protein [Fomitiporia mediterranea MF3/22]
MPSEIPGTCTVLVIGGGPAGAFAAAALAREGIDVILLEADNFPRYHIGESMLPAMRHMFRFIDVDSAFDSFGFIIKNGAAFKLNQHNREGYTDFVAAGGPNNYSWNVLRSESDNILFRHAAASGAKVFDGVKVTELSFKPDDASHLGRPIRASYVFKSNRETGDIAFDYIVDATGRAGLMCTKYLKNRTYNQSLKNIAMWAYWKGTGVYGIGTPREGAPLAEALIDESGWAWFIPLHIGTSVGIVMDQELTNKKKRAHDPPLSGLEFYLEQLRLAPTIMSLLGSANPTNIDDEQMVRSASDYSYSSSCYSGPGFRIAGDAGAFIDPFFSSGVHLALIGGLTAALTICASIRGDCTESEAADWHSKKIGSSFTWFLMVVLGAYKQMKSQRDAVLTDINEDNFDRAFSFIRPIIQGSIDVDEQLSVSDLSKVIDICVRAFEPAQTESREAVLAKLKDECFATQVYENSQYLCIGNVGENVLSDDEKRVLAYINAREVLGARDRALTMNAFVTDVIGGRRPRLKQGELGLEIATNRMS